MRLVHYADERTLVPYSVTQDDRTRTKPRGLWVSDEDSDYSWSWWCESEGFRNLGAQYPHVVRLADNANVLYLTEPDELIRFSQTYGFRRWSYDWDEVRWAEVAEQYAGIIITPYQWEHRLSLSWYYTWDCASGCIWNEDAIASTLLIDWRVAV